MFTPFFGWHASSWGVNLKTAHAWMDSGWASNNANRGTTSVHLKLKKYRQGMFRNALLARHMQRQPVVILTLRSLGTQPHQSFHDPIGCHLGTRMMQRHSAIVILRQRRIDMRP